MKKFLFVSDMHLTNKNSYYRYNSEGVSELLLHQYKFFQWVGDKLSDYDAFIDCGDITDYTQMSPILLSYLNKCFEQVISNCEHNIFVEGNHNITDKGNVFTVLGAMETFLDAFICNKTFQTYEIDDVTFHCLPFLSDYEDIEKKIKDKNSNIKDENGVHILVAHIPLSGATLDNYIDAKTGVDISGTDVSSFDVCMFGDYHLPQKLFDREHCMYVGSQFDLQASSDVVQRGPVEVIVDGGDIEINRLTNPFNRCIVKLEADEFISSEQDFSGDIVQIKGSVDAKQKEEIEKCRDQLYSLRYIGGGGRVHNSDNESVKTLERFSQNDDVKILKEELENLGIDKERHEGVLSIFHSVRS